MAKVGYKKSDIVGYSQEYDKINLQTSTTNKATIYYLLNEVASAGLVDKTFAKDELFPKARSKVQSVGGDWDPRKPDEHTTLTLEELGLIEYADATKYEVSDIGRLFLQMFKLKKVLLPTGKVELDIEDAANKDAIRILLFVIFTSVRKCDVRYGRDIHPYALLILMLLGDDVGGYITKREWAWFLNNSEWKDDSQKREIVSGLLLFRNGRAEQQLKKSDRILTMLKAWGVLAEQGGTGDLTAYSLDGGFRKVAIMIMTNEKYLSAIRTKPFILLAGISGTGKSRLVRQLAKGCCKADSELAHGNEPGNFASIAVRPNWHDSTELIGYVSRLGSKPRYVITDFVRFLAKAWLYEDTPFFLCLDEMNLAPVEQYFAEYLSVVESRSRNGENKIESDVLIKWTDDEIRKGALEELFGEDASPNVTLLKAKIDADKGLRLPPNLIVMGTVNMDETTFSFSRKVLDRAMSFELNEVDMDAGLQQCNDVEYGSILADSAKASLIKGCEAYAADQALCDKVKSYLIAINERLEGTSFKIAYRTRDEMMIYCIERTKGGLVGLVQALDEATSMKILSRIEGDTDRITEAKLTSFRNLIVGELLKVDGKAGSDAEVVEFLGDAEKVKASACCTKLNQMIKTVHDGAGFVSFWQC